jgi:hypothetical protein
MNRFLAAFLSLVALWVTPASAEVFGDLSGDLDGVSLTYHYASGRQYDVSFSGGKVSWQRKDVAREPVSGVPYVARKIADNLYLVNWGRRELVESITVLMDFDKRTLYTSALLEGNVPHFDLAKIVALTRAKPKQSK